MAVRFRSPDDKPHGCFHPRSRYHGFREGGVYWPSVAQYYLAKRVASPEDREKILRARDPEHAEEVAASMPILDGWREQEMDVLKRALLLSFQANLPLRAVLLATGDEPTSCLRRTASA